MQHSLARIWLEIHEVFLEVSSWENHRVKWMYQATFDYTGGSPLKMIIEHA